MILIRNGSIVLADDNRKAFTGLQSVSVKTDTALSAAVSVCCLDIWWSISQHLLLLPGAQYAAVCIAATAYQEMKTSKKQRSLLKMQVEAKKAEEEGRLYDPGA